MIKNLDAGPFTWNGVSAVMRRPYGELRTTVQRSPSSRISITPMPCAFLDFCTFSTDQFLTPSLSKRPSSCVFEVHR
jgi:hypothetical protein